MSEVKTPKKTGRPQKFPGEGARVSHSIRLKPSIAEKLAHEADKNHRSLGEEMEFRINQSFESIVVSVTDKTRQDLQKSATESNISIEEEAKRCIQAYRPMIDFGEHIAQCLPALRDLTSLLDGFRASRIGFILMMFMDMRFTDISNFLKKRVVIHNNMNIDDTKMINVKIRSNLDEVESLFNDKFGKDSIDDIVELIGEMLKPLIKTST